jgi:hypothetical protein
MSLHNGLHPVFGGITAHSGLSPIVYAVTSAFFSPTTQLINHTIQKSFRLAAGEKTAQTG